MKFFLPALLAAILSVASGSLLKAQTAEKPAGPRFVVHADAGLIGYGGIFTVNFEARVFKTKSIMLWARSGYGFFGVGSLGSSREIYGMPINITGLWGKKTHFLELTIGGIFGFEKETVDIEEYPVSFGIWPLVDIGYRLQLSPRGIVLRLKVGTGGIGGGIGYAF